MIGDVPAPPFALSRGENESVILDVALQMKRRNLQKRF